MKKLLSLLVSLVLIIVFASCAHKGDIGNNAKSDVGSEIEGDPSIKSASGCPYTEDQEFGNGEKTVNVTVNNNDSNVVFTIHTDKENLADAMLEHNLIDGEDGPYGLYVKSVNGIVADYDKDQTYWSLTKNGEYMTTGASDTLISDGECYEFTIAK